MQTFEALSSGLISKHVNSALVNNIAVLNLREIRAHGSGARGHISGPGSVAHTKEHWLAGAYVAGLAFVTDNGPVAPAAAIQDRDVRVRDVWESHAL